jgi:hypothetical protein
VFVARAVIQDDSSASAATASLAGSTTFRRSSAFYAPRTCIIPLVVGVDL